MAITLQTLSLIVLSQSYRGGIVNQANRQSVALKTLPFVRGEGQNVAFVPKGTGVTAEMYVEGAPVTTASSDAQVKALLPWASGRANFAVSGLAEACASTSSTPQGNLELWARNMIDGAAALASLLNVQIHTGNGNAPNLVGLATAIGTQNNTYAGIDRSANTYFNPNVFSGSAALTFALIRGDLSAIYVASGMRPDIAFVHPNVYQAIGALFDPQKLYNIPTEKKIVTQGGREVSFEGGPGAISFEGCYFVEDKDCPDGAIEYVNTRHARIEYLPADLSEVPGEQDEAVDMIADDGFGETPLGMRLEMLAKTGDSEQAMMKTYLQLVVDQPNSCGMRTGLAA